MKLMRMFLATALFCAVGVTAASAQCNVGQCAQPSVVEVTASARESMAPNKIEIRIEISQEPSKGKVELASLEALVVEAVRQVGLDPAKALKVVSQSSDYGKKNAVLGFKVFAMTLSSAEQTTLLFNKLADDGIAQTRIVNITHTDLPAIQQRVRAQAIVNARTSAQTAAQAIGQSIGKATQININNGYYPRPFVSMVNARSADVDAAKVAPQLQFQEIEVEQSVSARFELL